jgi:pimeloyl-ACP methyl ester carboxylesterase
MSLYVQETGPAGAPTIVFLHGGGGSGWMWQPQVDGLGDYHCLVPDLPEQGRSVDVKPFTIAGSAELIAELIRTRAHGGRAHVVGLSEGAQTTVALLAIAHDLVDTPSSAARWSDPSVAPGWLAPGSSGGPSACSWSRSGTSAGGRG